MKTKLLEEFTVKGHTNILSTHHSTLEFTKDSQLTLRGNCILGMESPISCLNLKDLTKEELRKEKKFLVKIQDGINHDEFIGFGHPNLTLNHPNDMVFRKSTYICDRTIMINCSKAAAEINRKIVHSLQDNTKQAQVQIHLIIED